jgi:dTDP-4-dehydrorhamnose 3,5-epimerase
MIDGVIVTPLKQFFDERGKVMHMLREDSPPFSRFGEIYFSCTYPGVVKAWHLHTKMTLNYAAIFGQIKCVLYDDRPASPTCGQVDEFFMSPENYFLLTVPPMVWNGWKGIGESQAIMANCATLPHSSNEIIRKSALDSDIPYNWDVEFK